MALFKVLKSLEWTRAIKEQEVKAGSPSHKVKRSRASGKKSSARTGDFFCRSALHLTCALPSSTSLLLPLRSPVPAVSASARPSGTQELQWQTPEGEWLDDGSWLVGRKIRVSVGWRS
eukprot:755699-Hanusia_phi.AAC.1